MKDPFPIPPPEWLVEASQPLANFLSMPTLALHMHEILFAFALYTFLFVVVSPIFSRAVWPQTYANLNRRTLVNWDVHIVSFFQSVFISALSLWVIFADEERKSIRPKNMWEQRIWEYTGAGGMVQSFALGYFTWDFIMCSYYINIFGVGMLAHAISALSVFALGYRPFIYFYAPVFLLYELSSPFLNIHWFCDKLNLTGSSIQAINGALLTSTFFGCRLIWGNLSSFWVFYDIFRSIQKGHTDLTTFDFGAPHIFSTRDLLRIYGEEQGQRLAFVGGQKIPLWLALAYLSSNITLNSLNIFWFGKMIQTIRKRFDPPFGTKGVGVDEIHYEPQEKVKAAARQAANAVTPSTQQGGSVKAARERAEAAMNGPVDTNDAASVQRANLPDGSRSIEVTETRSLRTRRKA